MASGVPSTRPTTFQEPSIVQTSPSVSKFSLFSQDSLKESDLMRTLAIFYVFASVIGLLVGTPMARRRKSATYSILVMGAFFVNFCIASQVLSILVNSKP